MATRSNGYLHSLATHHYPIDSSTFAWYKRPILGDVKLLNLLVLHGSRDNLPLGTSEINNLYAICLFQKVGVSALCPCSRCRSASAVPCVIKRSARRVIACR